MNIFFPIPYIKHKCRNAEFFGFCIISFEIWPEDPDEPGNSRYRRFSSKQCREAPLPYLVAAAQQHRCFDKVFRQPKELALIYTKYQHVNGRLLSEMERPSCGILHIRYSRVQCNQCKHRIVVPGSIHKDSLQLVHSAVNNMAQITISCTQYVFL